jgi:hypothetical protein
VSWDLQEVSPEQAITDRQPKKAQVTLNDGSRITLAHPSVSGDSLTGFWRETRVSVPLTLVSGIAVQQIDVVPTVLASVVGGILIVGAVGYVVHCDPFCP